jgi:hypothetical protein
LKSIIVTVVHVFFAENTKNEIQSTDINQNNKEQEKNKIDGLNSGCRLTNWNRIGREVVERRESESFLD